MGKVDINDHSNFFQAIPIESLGEGPASTVAWKKYKNGCGILLRDSRPSRYGSSNSIILAKNLKENQTYGETPVENRISFELPRVNRITIKNNKEYKDKYTITTLASSGIKIELDLYNEHYDTGGYFTRKTADIILDKEGNIEFIDAKFYKASRWLMVFGSIGDFKVKNTISCGKRK